MTPAVPDPTVEALSEAERRMLDEPIYNPNLDMHQRSDRVAEIVERILAARAAAPDALRVRLLEWVDDQRQLLPEHRTPAAHAKVELLRDLRALLDDPALDGRATGGEG